ncbi:uncharacterized protein LOC123224897 [Mangifera indica]|uniref:uncharacterized protein LOC123224897 n=1 Tax=Mangifera indica TaxID=29780 RepID=UPI001CFB11C8|nr:uncharacterized protein LOC123224897 [Mangifera indica]
MKAYLKAFDLWDMVIEIDKQPNLPPENPTLNQIKHHSEEVAKRYEVLSCIHFAVSKVMFAKIMALETAKEAWDKLKLEFHGSDKSKQMQIFNLKRKFALLRMKKDELVKDYIDRLMKIVNQLTLLGELISKNKVVAQVLVSLPEKFEAKIFSLEDSKDMSIITISELSNSLQVVELRQVKDESNLQSKNMAEDELQGSNDDEDRAPKMKSLANIYNKCNIVVFELVTYEKASRFSPTQANRKLENDNKKIIELIKGIIKKREEALKVGEASYDDLLVLLVKSNHREIQEHENKESGMSIEEVIEECKPFYLAGQETTANLIE